MDTSVNKSTSFRKTRHFVEQRVMKGLLVSLGMLFMQGALATAPTVTVTNVANIPSQTSGLYQPAWTVTQGSDGNLYGAAWQGATSYGGIFSVSLAGQYTDVYDFTGNAGAFPENGLMQAKNGAFYGAVVTANMENQYSNSDVIFSFTPTNQASFVHVFGPITNNTNADGASVIDKLVQTDDGTLYGVTHTAGPNGAGTIFSISTSGTFTVLYAFPSSADLASAGSVPAGGLTIGTDGNLYGTTVLGGSNNSGVIYRITPDGVFAALQSFPANADTGWCQSISGVVGSGGTLVLGMDGDLYGARCGPVGANGDGMIFKFDPATQVITTLYSFPANVNGGGPNGSLVQGPDGNFYGTTDTDGQYGEGTIFAMSPSGAFTTLYNFGVSPGVIGAGAWPLMIANDNNFYGTTMGGGANGTGAVFKVSHLPQNDLVMSNSSSGALDVRLMNQLGAQQILQNVAAGYYPVAVADFDGDGIPDILWTSANNDLYIWFGGKGNQTGFTKSYVGTYPAGWAVAGAGDINGDGKADIYWINSTTHQFGYWLMNGAQQLSLYQTSYTPGYYPAATGDFNGDGKTDVIWTSAKNDLYIWFSNASSTTSGFTPAYVGTYPSGWRLAGTGDLNGDGKSDLIWMKTDGTEWGYWLMSGATQLTSQVRAISGDSLGYGIVSVNDYSGDGLADLVWSNGSNLYLWTNSGTCGTGSCTFTSSILAPPVQGNTVFNSTTPPDY